MCKIGVQQPLGFQDANFPRRLRWKWSTLEGDSLCWSPYGMPRLNSRFKNMVFFLYGKDPRSGEVRGPLGTGFLIGQEGEGSWYMSHLYALTCYHVAIQHGASILRVNTKDGGSRQIELEPHEWQFIGGGDDLCAADITERLLDSDDVSAMPESLVMRRDFIVREEVEIGEDGFMLGLFADHPGKKQNFIAARFGNLSLLAQDNEPIEQPNGQKRPSHIFDLRSRPGFSGSPVFLYRTPAGDLRSATERGRDKAFRRMARRRPFFVGPGGDFGRETIDFSHFDEMEQDRNEHENTFLMLLGVHAGQYPERVEAWKVKKTAPESDDIVRDRDKLRIPSSMAVVVPAWEIVNLLNQTYFLELREKRNEAAMKNRDEKNIPEPEASDALASVPPATDDNPNLREDFMRLSNVAARKQKQDD